MAPRTRIPRRHFRMAISNPLERDEFRMNRSSRSSLLFEHDLFGKPVPTFPDHALFRPDASVQRFGLVLEQRSDDFNGTLAAAKHLAAGQVEGRVFRMIAGDAAQALLAEAVDHPANAGPVDRARAHRAGLGGGIERR